MNSGSSAALIFAAPVLALYAGFSAMYAPAFAQSAETPISGRPVLEFGWLDEEMVSYMERREITAGVLGIMRDGRIVYLRGFGTDYYGDDLPENTPMRLASISKPVTAAAVQHLIANGQLSLHEKAFNLGQPGGGILNLTPFGGLGDERLKDIEVQHLLAHEGGWNPRISSVSDYAFHDIECADEMGIPSPPGRVKKLEWILGKELQFIPGSDNKYSNINYHVLHEIVNQVSGLPLEWYVWTHILTSDQWTPITEIFAGRTLRDWQYPREPEYVSEIMMANVFDPEETVSEPYGGWELEAKVGFGGFAASAPAMLVFADIYRLNNPDPGTPLTEGWTGTGHFNGSLAGTNTSLRQFNSNQRTIRMFVGFNKRIEDGIVNPPPHWANNFMNAHWESILDSSQDWPTTTADGFWTLPPAGGGSGVGGFHRPFRGFQQMLDSTTSGSKIRLLPGTTNWTGEINKKLLIDAPIGSATIGAQ